mmetsp:Transcript_14137/g.46327  ORF Transcript_14137/g.46327 Transcript_14137/m.46327 type:complete len:291 (+) Transcript_14137:525-1397(+)
MRMAGSTATTVHHCNRDYDAARFQGEDEGILRTDWLHVPWDGAHTLRGALGRGEGVGVIEHHGARAHIGVVDVADHIALWRQWVFGGEAGREPRRLHSSDDVGFGGECVGDAPPGRKVGCDGGEHHRHVLLQGEQHCVRPGVERVAAHDRPARVVEGVHQPHHGTRGVVHVEDGWEGVEAGGVELVRVLHHQLGHRRKVPRPVSRLHPLHACWHDGGRAVREQRAGLDRSLHAGGGGDGLLGVGDDKDEHLQLGPVGLGRHLPRARVGAVGFAAHVPGDKASGQRPASRA